MKYRVYIYYDNMLKDWGCILFKKEKGWFKPWRNIADRLINGAEVANRWAKRYGAEIIINH